MRNAIVCPEFRACAIKLHAFGSSVKILWLRTSIQSPSLSTSANWASLAATAAGSQAPSRSWSVAKAFHCSGASSGICHTAPVLRHKRTSNKWLCDKVPYWMTVLCEKQVDKAETSAVCFLL